MCPHFGKSPLEGVCGSTPDALSFAITSACARVHIGRKLHAGREQRRCIERLGIEIPGPLTDPIEKRLSFCSSLEERRRGRILEFRLIENHRFIALLAIPDLALVIHAQGLVGDLARRDQVGIDAGTPERVGDLGADILEGGSGPVHGVGMAENHRHGTVQRRVGDLVQQPDAALAAKQRRAKQGLASVYIDLFGDGVNDVEVHPSAGERIAPDFFLIGLDAARIPLVEPDGPPNFLASDVRQL